MTTVLSAADAQGIADALVTVMGCGIGLGVCASMVGYLLYDWLAGRFTRE